MSLLARFGRKTRKLRNRYFPRPHAVFWIAAHKTGTTFLQESVEFSCERLLQLGVSYIPLLPFRHLFTWPAFSGGDVAPSPFRVPQVKTALVFDEEVGAPILSAIVGGQLYPDAVPRLRRMAAELRLQPDTVVVGIRSPDTWLASIYAETLLWSQEFVTFPQYVAEHCDAASTRPDDLLNAAAALRWSELIARLAAVNDGKRLLVYRQEDLRGSERRLLSEALQLPADTFTLSPQAARTRRLSREGYARMCADKTGREGRLPVLAELPVTEDNPAYDPWTTSERAQLQAAYAADIERIRQMPGVTLVELGGGEAKGPA